MSSTIKHRFLLLVATLATAISLHMEAAAQQYTWQPVGSANYNVDENWLDPEIGSFVPSAAFDETGVINNGGTAVISDTPPSPGGLTVSDGSTLEITGTGSLTTTATNVVDGDITIGAGGTPGTLTVASGGQLSVAGNLALFGNPTSLIEIAGSASVTVNGAADFNQPYRVIGPDATISINTLEMEDFGGAEYQPVITAGTHSVINVASTLTLAGALAADLSGAPSITPGTTWNLFEAATVVGGFSSTSDSSGSLARGLTIESQVISNPANAGATSLVQMVVGQELYLEIGSNGEATIKGPSETPIAIDGYSISSQSGYLDASDGAWNSLADQPSSPSLPGDWIEVGSSATQLSELQAVTTTGVTATSSLSLGNPFTPAPVALGQDVKELTFTYYLPSGEAVEGEVYYEDELSVANNLVLVVDPSTGESQIRNASGFIAEIEGYAIKTDEGSLDTAGWNSLFDQSESGWIEVSATGNELSELDANTATTLSSQATLGMGDLFAAAIPEDLTFEYLLAGDSVLTSGLVVFASLEAVNLPGDFNGDGVVDAADYTVWRDNLSSSESVLNGNGDGSGTVDVADYTLWKQNFGASAFGASTTPALAPEPTTLGLSALLMLGTAHLRSRYRS